MTPRRLNPLVAALALTIGLAGPARAATCPPASEAIVILATTVVGAALDALVNALFQSFNSLIETMGQRKVAGMKVLTSQVATASKAKINADMSLALGHVSALAHLETVKQQMRAYQDYNPATGQGVDPCGQMVAQTNASLANGQVGAMATESISRVAAAPGRYGNPEGWLDRMLQQHQSLFGTEDEAKLGLGPASKAEVTTSSGAKFSLAGADTDARVLFADSADPRVVTAKDAYLNHLAGPPDLAITADAAASPAGKEYLAIKSRKDAALSAALNSVATVGREYMPNQELGMSKMKALTDLVDQYYGRGALERTKGWASQSRRGLMVDHVKMNAALLAMESDQLAQAQRLEAVLGSMLALEAQRDYKPALGAVKQNAESVLGRPTVR